MAMIEKFQEVNKRRQEGGVCITPITMFAEAWDLRKEGVDKLQAECDALQNRIDEALRTIEPSDEISHSLYRKVYRILKGE